jgi:hypothetical protein
MVGKDRRKAGHETEQQHHGRRSRTVNALVGLFGQPVREGNMKVKEIIERLQKFNQGADFIIVNGSTPVGFRISFGSSEGVTPETAQDVCLFIDDVPETANENMSGAR